MNAHASIEPAVPVTGLSESDRPTTWLGRQSIYLFPFLVMGLVGLATFDVLDVVRSSSESGRLVQSSYDTISDTEELYSAISDAETEQRTFLLTQDPAALEEFQSARARALNAIGALAGQLSTPQQAPHLKAISQASHNRIAILDADMDLRNSSKDRSARFERGRETMAQLRRAITRIIASNARLIDERQRALAQKQYGAALEVFLAIVGLILAGWFGAGVFLRTRAELSVQTSEAFAAHKRLEAMFDQAAVGIGNVSPDGRWVRVNDRFCVISGYSRERLIGRRFEEITHPEDRPQDIARLKELLSGSMTKYSAEKKYVRPSGQVVWANVSASIIHDEHGKPDFIVKVMEDITDWKIAQARLITGEAQYRAIFDSAVEAIAVIDERGVIQSVNPASKQIFGHEPKDLIGCNISMLMPKAIAKQHNSYLARYKDTGERAIIGIGREVEGMRKDGSTFPLDLSVAEWKQEGKTYYTGIMRDITERKDALAELAKSEERLRLAQDATGIGSFDWDLVSGELIGNDSFYRLTGSDRQSKHTEESVLSIVHASDRDRISAELRENLADGVASDLEFRLAEVDGEPRWIRSMAKTIHDSDNQPVRRIGVLIDITDRKVAEDDLRQSSERLRLALASGNLGTWSFDPKAETIRFDLLAAAIFGVKPDDPTSLDTFKALLHPEDHPVFDRELRQLLAGADALNVEYRLPQPNGSVRWAHVSGTIDRAASPDHQQLIGVVADITDKRESEERLRLLQNEFAHLARVNDLGEMAAAIAHEINQPLTAISNYLNAGLETARNGAEPSAGSEIEEVMERAAEQALRAGQIVRRLREFIGKGTGEREGRSVDQLINAATEFAAVDAGVNGVTVIRKAGAGDATVSVDVVQFQQVVVNLIRNAIEALSTNPHGIERKLTVETKIGKTGKSVEFMVADTGPGVSKEISPKLFEPFTTSKPTGMGMGLSVCRRLIEAHGGSIWIESPAAGGANFHFTLPIDNVGA